jgi:hypothetical protein
LGSGIFARRCETIEQAYEFMLAYAAQGLSGDADNLNASIHVRALLTDLFLIDEILKK